MGSTLIRRQPRNPSQAVKGIELYPACDHYRQTEELRGGEGEVLTRFEHCRYKWHNNRAENSHQPTRLRERVMRRFKSAGHARRFLSAFGIITSHFRVGRHRYSASGYRTVMKSRFGLWEEAICGEAMV